MSVGESDWPVGLGTGEFSGPGEAATLLSSQTVETWSILADLVNS